FLNLNQWYYVALVRDKGSTLKIYINGVESNSETDITTGSILSNIDWIIGAKASNVGQEIFRGLIDEVKIHNHALSAAEILRNYEASADETNIE
ncbi:MAG TPA: LamG domain-containing protein, partial [Bacteroidales bacterium]|nr:LamG domain-containing protein [Bacteroidales bacterium]